MRGAPNDQDVAPSVPPTPPVVAVLPGSSVGRRLYADPINDIMITIKKISRVRRQSFAKKIFCDLYFNSLKISIIVFASAAWPGPGEFRYIVFRNS